MVKAGEFTMPGSGSTSITAPGFKPRWGIFLWSNFATEDTWASGPSAGIGIAALDNSLVSDTAMRNAGVAELWYNAGGYAASAFLGGLQSWIRQTDGVDGWAAYISSFDASGFTVTASSLTAGMSGRRVYYLVGDSSYEQVALTNAFVDASGNFNVGFEPMAFFGVGHGGGVNSPGDLQNFASSGGALNYCTDSVVAGHFGDTLGTPRRMNSVWRGIRDPDVSVQSWFGNQADHGGDHTILEQQVAGGAFWSDGFAPSRTATEFVPNVFQYGGFSSGEARIMPFILGNVECATGAFTPGTTVGGWTFVPLSFTPEGIVLFSPGEDKSGVASQRVFGYSGYGFCTETEQAVVAYGGFWNPPNTFQSNGFISSSRAWISDAVGSSSPTSGSVGTMVTAGSARIVPGGFEYQTDEYGGGGSFPVHYWAIGPIVEADAPGFFRVIN